MSSACTELYDASYVAVPIHQGVQVIQETAGDVEVCVYDLDDRRIWEAILELVTGPGRFTRNVVEGGINQVAPARCPFVLVA